MPRKVKPILDTWRETVSFGHVTALVNDPTSRDLDEILGELARRQASADAEAPKSPNEERVPQRT
jgi:hypothetical protein